MMCPDEKLILVEIIFLKILGINSNFVFCVRRRGWRVLCVRTHVYWFITFRCGIPSSQENCNLSAPVDSRVKMALRERWLMRSGILVSHSIG